MLQKRTLSLQNTPQFKKILCKTILLNLLNLILKFNILFLTPFVMNIFLYLENNVLKLVLQNPLLRIFTQNFKNFPVQKLFILSLQYF
jgi:hypothetical protein